MPWSTVEAAIAAAYEGETLRAVDVEAMASRTTRDKPNPNKRPTVRRTGSEGAYLPREPISAVERARVRAAVEELPIPSRMLVVGWALRHSQREISRLLRGRGYSFDQRVVRSLRENGLRKRVAPQNRREQA